MKVDAAAYSSVGKRANNEDAFFAAQGEKAFLALVCDGLGGHVNGELASRCAVEIISDALLSEPLDGDLLEDAIIHANSAVCSIRVGEENPKTTVAALWLGRETALAANVGDSRIYQLRNGEIIYQSRDHSVPQLAVMTGEITADQIRTHKDRNKITHCLGSEGPVKIDKKKLTVLPGDRFLLCSDGFWEPVLESDMLMAAEKSTDAEHWLAPLHEIASAHEKDNHTAVALIVKE